jgi:hypothetical protein
MGRRAGVDAVRHERTWQVGAVRLAVVLALAAQLATPAHSAQAAAQDAAPGGPGTLAHFDLARKDCLGTARNRTSKVWYTVANGVLSVVYYPTADNTNVETLQFIVTDGATFTDLQCTSRSLLARTSWSDPARCSRPGRGHSREETADPAVGQRSGEPTPLRRARPTTWSRSMTQC